MAKKTYETTYLDIMNTAQQLSQLDINKTAHLKMMLNEETPHDPLAFKSV